MSKVVTIMSMSLDGYVADRNDGVAEVFDWYLNSGDVEFHTGGSDPMTFRVSAPSAKHLRALTSGLGAMLTGRRTFDAAQGWGGNHAWGPAFVLTHQIPAGWPRPNSTVHFVTDGIESAVAQAKAAAAGKSVGVHGADTIQQLLNAGSSTRSTSTSRRFFLDPAFDSSTTSPARQSSSATRRSSRASALHTCAIRYARHSRRSLRRHPDKVAGLVYLEAGYDYAFYDQSHGNLAIDINEIERQRDKLRFGSGASPQERRTAMQTLADTSLPGFLKWLRGMLKEPPPLGAPVSRPMARVPYDRDAGKRIRAWRPTGARRSNPAR